jgi:hypothetical protein
MNTPHRHRPNAALTSLEAAATLARGGFACMFSTPDEYETALLTQRRAQGRYDQLPSRWLARSLVCRLCADGRRYRAAFELSSSGAGDVKAPQGAFFFASVIFRNRGGRLLLFNRLS